MASIQCNPEVDFCGTPSAVEGNYFERMEPATAKFWFGLLAYFNVVVTDIIARKTANDQGIWNSKSNRRSKNQNSAIWAWNLMFFWHNFVFIGVLEFWLLGYLYGRYNAIDRMFYWCAGLSMAGPYGVYEVIITLLVAAITSEDADQYTDQNSLLLTWYTISAVFTGLGQILLHKGVTEWYYLHHTGSWSVEQEDIPENPNEKDTDTEIVGLDDQKSDAKTTSSGKLFMNSTPVF